MIVVTGAAKTRGGPADSQRRGSRRHRRRRSPSGARRPTGRTRRTHPVRRLHRPRQSADRLRRLRARVVDLLQRGTPPAFPTPQRREGGRRRQRRRLRLHQHAASRRLRNRPGRRPPRHRTTHRRIRATRGHSAQRLVRRKLHREPRHRPRHRRAPRQRRGRACRCGATPGLCGCGGRSHDIDRIHRPDLGTGRRQRIHHGRADRNGDHGERQTRHLHGPELR